jgi:hypothetical protein
MRDRYRALGFTLTPPARHPFGTGNSLVQLNGSFLELLTVIQPDAIPEHYPGHFSFAAFTRDFLARRDGFSMLVLDSVDARADVAAFRDAGLETYEPFDFSRKAILPSGEEVTVGFSLAFVTHPDLPRAGFFTCQQHAPQHFWRAEYQRHANGAVVVLEVCLVADDPESYAPFMTRFAGAPPEPMPGGVRLSTRRGDILIMEPQAFADCYRVSAPLLSDGPEFSGFAIGLADMTFIETLGLQRDGDWRIIGPERAFGTAIAFAPLKRQ